MKTKDDLVREALALTVVRPTASPLADPHKWRLSPTRGDILHFNEPPSPSPTPVEKYRRNKISGLKFGPAESARTKKDKVKTEPLEKSPDKVREDMGPTCKPRPRHNKGNGGSRAFVPWCDRKR